LSLRIGCCSGCKWGALGEMGEITLEPDDIVALAVATERLTANPSLLHLPELQFFRELLLSWGGRVAPQKNEGNSNPATTVDGLKIDAEDTPIRVSEALHVPEDGPEVTNKTKAPEKPPKPVEVLELESDDEAPAPRGQMDLPPGELEGELDSEEDPEKDKAEPPGDDPERMTKDSPPYPPLPPAGSTEPSEARKKALAKVKNLAGQALERGEINKALDQYTLAISTGGASALMLATRGALLLKQRLPCAAIRDCCVALKLNPDCGKAFHVRGLAHRKLGHWKKAHRDLSQGQKLDFSEESVSVHMFVAKKVGLQQDIRTGRWYHAEGAQKAVELLFTEEGKEKRHARGSSADLRPGQAVRIGGLQKAPHLNGKRGIVQRLNPNDKSRWEVEVRLDRGRLEVKSIRGENIIVVRAAEAEGWKEDERRHGEERHRREK